MVYIFLFHINPPGFPSAGWVSHLKYIREGEIYMWRIVATILCIFVIWLVFWLEGDDEWNL